MPRGLRSLATTALLCLALPAGAETDSRHPPIESLQALQNTYATRFNSAAVYWGVGGALLVTGGLTLGLSPITEPTPQGRLELISGTATIVSGLDSIFSAIPLTLGPLVFQRRLAVHGGLSAIDEAAAYQILSEQAEWARRWRIATLVVSTGLLAINCAALTWYAVNYSYQRVTTAVVAGLYGLGVLVVPFYDLLPWDEEKAFQNTQAPSQLTIRPGALETRHGVAPGVQISGTF